VVIGGVLVVISLYRGASHVADDVEAGDGIGVVANDIAKADIVCDTLARGVSEDGFESLKVCMDVTE
jgi:hypothetical protein